MVKKTNYHFYYSKKKKVVIDVQENYEVGDFMTAITDSQIL